MAKAAPKFVDWDKVDKAISGLATNVPHEILVRREAIPIIFVPGVMGSRLRLAGTNGTGERGGLPNLRWDPALGELYKNYSGVTPARRKLMLIGDGAFDPEFLEVDNDPIVGNGYRGLMKEYRTFLEVLRTRDWGALGKMFVFPVYGFGYNWSASNRLSGAKLATRIQEVIGEGRKHAKVCEKVILVTHSMGGLVARAACLLAGAEGKVLGVVHGVQPAYGAPAAYWRIKAGFEGGGFSGRIASRFLGPTGRDVTALLANAEGGLQLLPNKQFMNNTGVKRWLEIPNLGGILHMLPRHGDPFQEIYRVPAIIEPTPGTAESNNAYWGLVDPALLTPEVVKAKTDNELDVAADAMTAESAPWKQFLANLAEAESFGDALGSYRHPKTWYFNGTGLDTATTVSYVIESNWVRSESYPTRGFRGFLRGERGTSQQAVLQQPTGNGDGTVPILSATFNGSMTATPGPPAHQSFEGLEHQPAYENSDVQAWAICAITALAHERYKETRG